MRGVRGRPHHSGLPALFVARSSLCRGLPPANTRRPHSQWFANRPSPFSPPRGSTASLLPDSLLFRALRSVPRHFLSRTAASPLPSVHFVPVPGAALALPPPRPPSRGSCELGCRAEPHVTIDAPSEERNGQETGQTRYGNLLANFLRSSFPLRACSSTTVAIRLANQPNLTTTCSVSSALPLPPLVVTSFVPSVVITMQSRLRDAVRQREKRRRPRLGSPPRLGGTSAALVPDAAAGSAQGQTPQADPARLCFHPIESATARRPENGGKEGGRGGGASRGAVRKCMGAGLAKEGQQGHAPSTGARQWPRPAAWQGMKEMRVGGDGG